MWGLGLFDVKSVVATLIVFVIMACLSLWLSRMSSVLMRVVATLAVLTMYSMSVLSLLNLGQLTESGTWFTSLAEVAVAAMALREIILGRHKAVPEQAGWNDFVRDANRRYFNGEVSAIGYLDNLRNETSSDVTADVHTIYPDTTTLHIAVKKTLQGLPPQQCWVALDGDKVVGVYSGSDAPPLSAASR